MSKDAAAKVRFIGFRSLNQLGTTREASDASSTYIALIFAVSATVGLLLAIDPPWAAVLAAGSPLIAAANYAKRYRDLLDYRIIYLLALLLWSYQPTFGLIGLLTADRSAVDSFNPVIFVHYSLGLTLSPLLVLFFRRPSVCYPQIKINVSRSFLVSLSLWSGYALCALTLLTFVAVEGKSGFLDVALGNFPRSILLLIQAVISLRYARTKQYGRLLVLTIATIGIFSFHVANRTSMGIPAIIGALAALESSALVTRPLMSKRTIGIVAVLFTLLVTADLQKQTGTSIVVSAATVASDPSSLVAVFENSNYAARSDGTELFFQFLNLTIGQDHYRPGSWAMQLLTIFTPRSIYPDKPEYDISKLYFSEGLIDRPLYYDFLFDRLIDSGAIGVLLYHVFYLFIMRSILSLRGLLASNGLEHLGLGIYFISLVTFFLVMRGPIILFAWFVAAPVLIGIAALLARAFFRGSVVHGVRR